MSVNKEQTPPEPSVPDGLVRHKCWYTTLLLEIPDGTT
jgi:hypothetical protein